MSFSIVRFLIPAMLIVAGGLPSHALADGWTVGNVYVIETVGNSGGANSQSTSNLGPSSCTDRATCESQNGSPVATDRNYERILARRYTKNGSPPALQVSITLEATAAPGTTQGGGTATASGYALSKSLDVSSGTQAEASLPGGSGNSSISAVGYISATTDARVQLEETATAATTGFGSWARGDGYAYAGWSAP